MATIPKKPLTEAQYQAQSGQLAQQEAETQKKLEATPGYFSNITAPTKSAIVKDVQLSDLQARQEALKSQKLAQDWYGVSGSEDSMVSKPQEGWLMSALNALAQPLYAEVGAAKYLLGKAAPGKNILESMDESRKGRETYGSLLKQYNIPTPVAAPLGFAMDVALDPVNMLMLGEVGTVGKIATGVKEAGIEGGVAAAKSSGFNFLKTVSKVLPEVGKSDRAVQVRRAIEELSMAGKTGLTEHSPEVINFIKNNIEPATTFTARLKQGLYSTGEKIGELKSGLTEKAAEAKTAYETLTGRTMEKMLEERAMKLTMGDYARNIISKVPGGEKFLNIADYNTTKWTQRAMATDKVLDAFKRNEAMLSDVYDPVKGFKVNPNFTENQINDILGTFLNVVRDTPDEIVLKANRDTESIIRELNSSLDQAIELGKSSKNITRGSTVFENAANMFDEVSHEEKVNNLRDIIKEFSGKSTGIETFDKLTQNFNKLKVGNVKVGEKILNAYGKFIGIFKSMKLGPLSPASMVYATVGNVTMTHMAGLDLTRPVLYKRWGQAFNYLRGKEGEEIARIITTNPEIKQLATEFPTYFARVFGFTYQEALAKNALLLFTQKSIEEGLDLLSPEFLSAKKEFVSTLDKTLRENIEIRRGIKSMTTPTQLAEQARSEVETGLKKGVQLSEAEKLAAKTIEEGQVGLAVNELSMSPFIDLKNSLSSSALKGNKFAKIASWALDQTEKYQLVDQTSRLGTFVSLIEDGVTEKELARIAGWSGFGLTAGGTKISPADIAMTTTKNGEKLYHFTPLKASQIVNDIYMNYNAMPAAVQVLRQLPILGSPFFAFTYAMAMKTGETALTNPSAFNKVSFLLNEIQKDKSPLEKAALNTKYYSWYNQPGMINLGKLPFFSDNPIYMNVANMIPYYSMNMFMPSERKFSEGIRGQLATAIDNVPFLKDPIGQLITDYFILPSIIQDVQPQNMWGGPLYPKSAPWYQKYITAPVKQLGESVVPSSVALTAPLASAILPDNIISSIPSYPFRKVAFGVQGKTPVGVTAKEDAASRGLRSMLSLVGVNLYPEDLSNLTYQVKKSMKKK